MKKEWTTPQGSYYTLYKDMLQQPHLLIAGATGSGKSVVINGLLCTALYDSPAAVQLILIDPKRVELIDFKPLPHTLKYASEGKGFRAFLNTILAIAVQNCLDEFNRYRPGLLVVDSPILSLKEKEDHIGEEHTSETMKTGLFKYLLSHQDGRQTIIIENEIPKLDYSSAHLEEFTKDENRGRYGLITGYRD